MTVLKLADRKLVKKPRQKTYSHWLPDEILDICAKLQRPGYDRSYEEVLGLTLAEGKAAGIPVKLCRAIVTGLWACQQWSDNEIERDKRRSKINWTRQQPMIKGTLMSKLLLQEAKKHTKAGISLMQSHLILAFMLRRRSKNITVDDWIPLQHALEATFVVDKATAKNALFTKLRHQYRRLKNSHNAEIIARSYMSQVFATL